MRTLPEEASHDQSQDTQRLPFKGEIAQIMPGGRGGFVKFEQPLKSAERGCFRAALIDSGYGTLSKPGAKVEGVALANGAIVAEVLELHIRTED